VIPKELYNCRVQYILVVCIDRIGGFPEAITTVFSKTVIHSRKIIGIF